MYINLLGLFMDKLNGIIISSNGSIWRYPDQFLQWDRLYYSHILETYLKWADMISGLFYLLSDYEQARQHIPPVSWSVSMSGNIYPVWLHGS